jgi:hypothetical protein
MWTPRYIRRVIVNWRWATGWILEPWPQPSFLASWDGEDFETLYSLIS